jgi:membrane fusion protein (multidrug efflux system)
VRAQADINRAEAQLQQAELNLSYTKIVSPADGYVTRKTAEAGAFVQAGQSLMAIVRPEVWVTANFKETQLTRMHPGQPATITMDSFPDVTFTGHVESIQHGTGSRFSLLPPENATGNFIKVVQRVPVKIVLDPNDQLRHHLLVPGLSAEPQIDVTAEGFPEASADSARIASDTASAAGSAK